MPLVQSFPKGRLNILVAILGLQIFLQLGLNYHFVVACPLLFVFALSTGFSY